MSIPEANRPPTETLTVVTWNILHDVTRTKAGLVQSQSDRASSLAQTLNALRGELQTELDVVGLQEVHKEVSKERTQHNGEYISEALGYGKGHWVEHNEKPYTGSKTGRKDEFAGLFGAQVNQADTIELGDNRRAVVTHVGDTTVVTIHTRARFRNRQLQKEQVRVVLDFVADNEKVAFMGDFNCWRGGLARRAVEAHGFDSVFTVMDKPHPKTFPTPAYRKILYGAASYVAPSVTLDEIYVRGLNVYDADAFEGDSDHYGLYAIIG